jgi:hypothetical protein
MDAAKPNKIIGLGAMDSTKPYKFIRFGAMDATKPYIPKTPKPLINENF